MPALLVALLAAYGLILGGALASFACVLSERVPAGAPIMGRSHCACRRQLRWFENVPVLGWLSCRGVARCGGAVLPARYVLCELGLSVAVGLPAALTGWAMAVSAGPVGSRP